MTLLPNGYQGSFVWRDIHFRVREAPLLEYETVFLQVITSSEAAKVLQDMVFGVPQAEGRVADEMDMTAATFQAALNALKPIHYIFLREQMLALLDFDADGQGEYNDMTDKSGRLGPHRLLLDNKLKMMDYSIITIRTFNIVYADFFVSIHHATEELKTEEAKKPEAEQKPVGPLQAVQHLFLGSV